MIHGAAERKWRGGIWVFYDNSIPLYERDHNKPELHQIKATRYTTMRGDLSTTWGGRLMYIDVIDMVLIWY